MDYDNTNTGALFNNKENKTSDKAPDYKGQINVGGVEYWLSAWIKPTKKDPSVRFMSLSVQPKEAQQAPKQAPQQRKQSNDFDDDRSIPF